MKIHVFKVTPQRGAARLEDLIEAISQTPIEDRMRIIHHTDIRMDDAQQAEDFWLMDFVRGRTSGPGRLHPARPLQGFQFGDGESFGEETAALFDPRTSCLVMQYNHFGVRANSVREYFCMFDRDAANVYDVAPLLDEDVERRLRRKRIFRKVGVKIAPVRMTAGDRRAGESLLDVIDMGQDGNADRISIELSVERGNQGGLNPEVVRSIINMARRIWRADVDSVDKIVVVGKDAPDAEQETLDLLSARLSVSFSDLHAGADLRIPREARWDALLRAHRGWRDLLRRT